MLMPKRLSPRPKLVRVVASVLFFAAIVAVGLTSAPKRNVWAQGASPAPTAVPGQIYGIPEKSLGWPQDVWTIRRQQCIALFNELSARQSMPRAEAAKRPKIKREDVTSCLVMKAGPVPPPTTARSNAPEVSPIDTPTASPTPSSSSVTSQLHSLSSVRLHDSCLGCRA